MWLSRALLPRFAGGLLFILGGATLGRAFTPPEDGLYAVFSTSAGEFAARLHFQTVPGTVANFIRLAEGLAPTLDRADGSIDQRPFYDGLTFHRVAQPFGIFSGSPDGSPGAGAGYLLPSELFAGFDYEQPGALAMYNPGYNAISSQFFVTTAPELLTDTPQLYGRHPVFGEIVAGMPVVEAIAAAPTENGLPLQPVVLERVTIVREGAAAEAFDALDPVPGDPFVAIPHVEPVELDLQLDPSGGRHELHFPQPVWSNHFLYATTNLQDWGELGVRQIFETVREDPIALFSSVLDAPGRRFYRLVRTRGLPSQSLNGKTLQVFGVDGAEPIEISFQAGFTGRYRVYDIPGDRVFEGGVRNYRVWQPGHLVQVLVEFESLVLVADDDEVFVTQPQQIFLYFSAEDEAGLSGTALVHFVEVEGLPMINLAAHFAIIDTPPNP